MRRILLLLLTLLASPGWAAPDLAAGRKLLSHYGWTCESGTVEMAFSVSDSLNGNPETFYQSASKKIGLDLSPARGQDVTLVRYTLSRRSKESHSAIFAHLAFFKGKIVGAWLSTDAPIAPGIAPLDDNEFGQDF